MKQLRTEFCISKERASLADVHLPGAMTQPLSWPSGRSRNSDFYLEVVTLNLEAWRTCWGWGCVFLGLHRKLYSQDAGEFLVSKLG